MHNYTYVEAVVELYERVDWLNDTGGVEVSKNKNKNPITRRNCREPFNIFRSNFKIARLMQLEDLFIL